MKQASASRASVHKTAVLPLVLLLLAVPAAAQTAQSYSLEPDGDTWVHTHVVDADGNATYEVQDGLTLLDASPGNATLEGTTVTLRPDGSPMTLRFTGPASITIPSIGPATLSIRTDATVDAPGEPVSQEDGLVTFQAQPGETYTVQEAAETVTVTATPGPTETPAFDWTALVVGLLAGVLLWAFLVQRGLVQRRSRKQSVAAAAHTTAAAEGAAMLDARRRTLMAALKELEKAKMNKEVPDEVYDRLKADLKKQTVTVLRALDEAKDPTPPAQR